jgi:hypothetical protein
MKDIKPESWKLENGEPSDIGLRGGSRFMGTDSLKRHFASLGFLPSDIGLSGGPRFMETDSLKRHSASLCFLPTFGKAIQFQKTPMSLHLRSLKCVLVFPRLVCT